MEHLFQEIKAEAAALRSTVSMIRDAAARQNSPSAFDEPARQIMASATRLEALIPKFGAIKLAPPEDAPAAAEEAAAEEPSDPTAPTKAKSKKAKSEKKG